jgi:hypothetical protein
MLYPNEELLQIYEKKVAEERALKLKSKKEKPEDESMPSTSQNRDPVKIKNEKAKIKLETGLKLKRKPESMQDDPNVSKALKSIFTTSEAAKNQPKSHWVTHNPLYF